jgi:ribosome-associated toxin RatA of RatAB toxin-antitoxin module
MRSTIGTDVAAPATLVFALARNVERWPELLPHYASARRLAPPDRDGRLLVRFVARRVVVPVLGLAIPVAWRSMTWAETDGCRLRFVHRGGPTHGMDVTWRIIDDGHGGCHVEIEHEFAPRVPGWAVLIDRLFTRPIAGRTLASFRAIAEAAAASADQSIASSPTNLPT